MSPPLARITFAAVRAIGILAVGAPSAVKTRRAVLTISVSVGAIHFYAQQFERLDAPPEVIMISGVISIRTARVRWGFDRRLAWRRLEPGSKPGSRPLEYGLLRGGESELGQTAKSVLEWLISAPWMGPDTCVEH